MKYFGRITNYEIGMFNEKYSGEGFDEPTLCIDFVYKEADSDECQTLIKITGNSIIEFIKKFNLDHLEDIKGKGAVVNASSSAENSDTVYEIVAINLHFD